MDDKDFLHKESQHPKAALEDTIIFTAVICTTVPDDEGFTTRPNIMNNVPF